MSRSRIFQPDLESEVYIRYRFRRDHQKLRINYAWFRATFRSIFRNAGETAPTSKKTFVFMKIRGITLQAIKDTKKKTVEQRIHLVRDQLIRYDDHQRRPARDPSVFSSVWGRTPPRNHWAMVEYCIAMNVETKKSYGNKGSKENQVKSLDSCREMSGIALFNFGVQEQPLKTYALVPLACKYVKQKDGKIIYNVREARSKAIRKEAESYPNNVTV